jgi:putative nucleotidyltransferase with HDIG domain
MMAYVQRQYVRRTEDSVQELQRMYEELASANREVVGASRAIRQLNDELFATLAKIIDARDPYVAGHAAKVAEYATAIALEMDLPAERVEHVHQAALLHDVGKIAISERVLHKPGKLTGEEHKYFKTHAKMGAEFLETSQGLRHLASFVRHHHERWDGTGYPDGLRRKQSPLEARILAVADAVEAMASDRPYSRASSMSEIVAELRRCAGTQFDPSVAEAFVRVIERKGESLVTNSARQVVQMQSEGAYPVQDRNGWFIFRPVAVTSGAAS